MSGVKRQWAPLSVDHGYYDPLMTGSIDGTDDRPHDRAVMRALQSKYRPNKQVKGDPKATIFVARLNPTTTEDSLKEVFSKYGKIRHCRLVKDLVTGRSKCYAFIEYSHREDAYKASERSHHMILDSNEIIVEMELERILPGWKPRRFGGGFSGKKESGQLRFGGRERPFRKPIVLGSKSFGRGERRRGSWYDNERSRGDWNRDRDRKIRIDKHNS